MGIQDRRAASVLRAPLSAAHYRAAAGMIRRSPRPMNSARRYVTGWGEYPYRCEVRTPIGLVAPTLYSRHDMLTLNEVFFRGDYRSRGQLHVAVDIGSNIGLSALYFLTRNRASRVFLFEPDGRNVARLRENLSGYADRYSLDEVAVALCDGEGEFGTEPSGRYGLLFSEAGDGHPLYRPTDRVIVRKREINSVLEGVLRDEERIDVLKIDTEGSELELVRGIKEHLLDAIGTIFYETAKPTPLYEDRFEFHFACLTNRLTHRSRARGAETSVGRRLRA